MLAPTAGIWMPKHTFVSPSDHALGCECGGARLQEAHLRVIGRAPAAALVDDVGVRIGVRLVRARHIRRRRRIALCRLALRRLALRRLLLCAQYAPASDPTV